MSNHAIGMNRDDATRRVMTAIAVGPKRVVLPFTAADGSKPLVVTTPNEYLSTVIERIDAVGGSANVALAEARRFTIFMIERQREFVESEDSDQEVNQDLSMGMFYIHAARNRSSNFTIRDARALIPAKRQEFAYAN